MRNIDVFNEFVAVILAQLYESFPVKEDLDVRTISGHTDENEFGIICAPDGRESKEAQVAYSTIEWLVDTGYIRADKPRPYRAFRGCVLTAEGLKLLHATPESVQVKETVGDKLVRLVREGTPELARDAVKALLTLGAGGVG